MFNAITNAFVAASLNGDNLVMGKWIYNACTKQPKFKEGWSFNGSYKTYQALKAQGKIS